MDLELKKKQESAFDPQLEAQAKNWIQAVTGETITDLHQSLKDGVILCKLVNKIRPNTIRKINPPKSAFMMMENIGSFLKSCQAFGINKVDQFMTVDLFEAKNMNQVIHCIHALARAAKNVPGFSGPYMETTPNVTPRVDTSTTQTSGHGDKDSGTMTSEQQLKGTEQKQIEEHKHEEKERREREEREREEKERREREEREREEREREERERREREEREREERELREREERERREREEREREERELREREEREREERELREREERERREREEREREEKERREREEREREERERREREEREREERERREREERERREREEREREERERREREEREREERERREREEREREERERREREARERERREREERERREREEREREERERELHAKSPTKRGLQDLEQRIARLEELKVLIAKQIVEAEENQFKLGDEVDAMKKKRNDITHKIEEIAELVEGL
jgi:hypothetical protein